jgi:hypothetical protein
MSLASDGVDITAGTGTTIATQLVGSKEYQVVMLASDSGHVQGTVPTYSFFIKTSAGAAAKIHFDLFNAVGSGFVLEMRGLWISPQISGTAVTGLISPDFDFYRTSSVGTGGTAVVSGSATFPSIALADTANTPALPASVTMRAAPTAGAASLNALFTTYVTQEETQAGAQLGQFWNVLPNALDTQRYVARPGQGFKLVQTTLGVAQNYSIFGVFTLI